MPFYRVGISVTISKTYHVEAPDKSKADAAAYKCFTLDVEESEHYIADTDFIEEIEAVDVLDARYSG